MDTDTNKKKLVKYPSSLNLNLGMVIFAAILIYVLICVVAYFRSSHVVGYEVKEGSLSANRVYNSAFVIRKEAVYSSASSGYINYFASEGSRVGVGGLVYTIDSAGGLQEMMMAEGTGSIELTAADYDELRSQIVSFSSSFDLHQYSSVYNFKSGLQGKAQKLTNTRILESMQAVNDARVESIDYCRASGTGIVVYNTDGYESIDRSALTSDIVNGDAPYTRQQIDDNGLVAEGDVVYKLIEDENWSVVIETDADTAESLLAEEYVKIRFLKNRDEIWGKVSTFVNEDNKHFVEFSFNNSALSFCTDRYLSIELLLQEEKGLKIPNSSVVEKSFYLVDTSFVVMGQNGKEGVMKQTYTEAGKAEMVFVETQIYYEKNGKSYIDKTQLNAGDLIYMPNSTVTLTIGEQDTLIGVYNINKGFADFKQVTILFQGDEYSIVESNTMYGLSVYDHIVLDATTINENQLIYD